MKQSLKVTFLLGICLFVPSVTFAAVPDVYTNENYESSTHEPPASFVRDGAGGFYGQTISGRPFTQTKIDNNLDIRLYRFSIDEAYFYISDRGQIWAENDLAAVSMYFLM